MGYFGPKIAHPHNSGSALRIFKKSCRMKGANRYMKILLVVFLEKSHLGQFDIFSLSAIFYCLIRHGQIGPGHCNWNLKQSGYDFFHDYYWILKQSGHYFFHDYYWILKQSGHDFFHDYYWILKQSRHDFSNKHLCDGYCMDIM